MKKLIKLIKKWFRGQDMDLQNSIRNVEKMGKTEIANVEDTIQKVENEHEQTVKELLVILEDQRDLELEKQKAQINAKVQATIAEMKQKAIDVKENEKAAKIAMIKSWLSNI